MHNKYLFKCKQRQEKRRRKKERNWKSIYDNAIHGVPFHLAPPPVLRALVSSIRHSICIMSAVCAVLCYFYSSFVVCRIMVHGMAVNFPAYEGNGENRNGSAKPTGEKHIFVFLIQSTVSRPYANTTRHRLHTHTSHHIFWRNRNHVWVIIRPHWRRASANGDEWVAHDLTRWENWTASSNRKENSPSAKFVLPTKNHSTQ